MQGVYKLPHNHARRQIHCHALTHPREGTRAVTYVILVIVSRKNHTTGSLSLTLYHTLQKYFHFQ